MNYSPQDSQAYPKSCPSAADVYSLQVSPTLQLPPPLLRPDFLLHLGGLLHTQPGARLARGAGGLVEQFPAEHVREPDDPSADGGAVSAVLALAPRAGDAADKVPQAALGEDFARLGVAARHPVRGDAQAGRDLGVFGFDGINNAFFFETLVRVLDGFLVHGFKV